MDPTDVYGWLDTDGTIYLRATKINDNYIKLSNNRMPTYNEINKVIIEEPIAPNGSISQMFYPCRNLTTIENINYFHTENVTNMAEMFSTCESLENIDVSGFDTSSVTNMGAMFGSCKALREIDVSNFDTSQVTSTSWMFGDCKLLTKIDLSNFDTSNVTNIAAMLCGLSHITKLDLSNFNTSNVDTISSLFAGTPLRELNLGRNFILKQNLSTNGMEFSNVPNSVKITTTRSTAERIKQIKPSFTDANFIIID